MPKPPRPLAERFWPRVLKSDGCWLWTGYRQPNGYGQVGRGLRGGGHDLAHRAAYALTYGAIPPDTMVCHCCDNPPCVRPDHLFLGSTADNVFDKMAKGRATAPPTNHGRRGNGAKLTDAEVREIRQRFAGGESQSDLARAFHSTQPAISLLVHRRTYQDVP